MTDDERHMAMALTEARRGLGLTSPNPPVGAVIVRGVRSVINVAYHQKAGGPHAEINAIAPCEPRHLRGATLYVTLEPCSSRGQTPPCTQAIIDAGIKRVVYATRDPNPAHLGRADRILRSHGIEVTNGVLQQEAQELIRPWTHWITTGRPWVIAKVGSSLDGRITRPGDEPQWLTSKGARQDAQLLRRRVDAILIGAGTLLADNPSLTVRGAAAKGKKQPLRAILAGSRRLDRGARVFTDRHSKSTIVYRKHSVEEAIRALGGRGVTSILIEGGGRVLGEAFAEGLVDEVQFYFAPILCGASSTPSIGLHLPASVQLDGVAVISIGGDNVRVSGYPIRPRHRSGS